MLSPADIARLAANLAQLGLDPAVYLSGGIAIGWSLSDETASAPEIGNGLAPHTNGIVGRRLGSPLHPSAEAFAL